MFVCISCTDLHQNRRREMCNTRAKLHLHFPSKVIIYTSTCFSIFTNAECYFTEIFFCTKFYTNRWRTKTLIKVPIPVRRLSHNCCWFYNSLYRTAPQNETWTKTERYKSALACKICAKEVYIYIQSGPKVGIQCIVYNYCNNYCIPTFGPLCIYIYML